ncbi:hypothetical protein CQW23_12875 [Capsicum baccatum]|uniref:Uncharacterized protein n=1 Tax=Capsicum baccatum TaxID=33114 RepID=A0A2G2WTU5_CAPBA|nr:hypothetical protein CQW23_12875 [Capsicum baccatum]
MLMLLLYSHSGTVSETVDVPVEEDAELSVNATERSVVVKRIDDLYSIRFTVSAIECKDDVEGILGKTYQLGDVSPVKRGVVMPIMDGKDKYQTPSLHSSLHKMKVSKTLKCCFILMRQRY